MPKKNLLLFIIVFFLSSLIFFVPLSSSDEIDDITSQINNLTNALNMSKAATAPLESQLVSMQSQIADIKNRVAFIEQDVAVKKKNIDTGYVQFATQQKILYETIQDFYEKSYNNSPLLTLLSASSASDITKQLAYQQAATDRDKEIIANLALTLQDLETKKAALEDEETRLTVVKANLDKQSAALDVIVIGAQAYQATLTSQIAQLSQKQQQLLAQKLSSLNIPRSAYTLQGGCVDDRGVDPGFSPRFALFTYGVPNRIGLNQYGAKGRAEAGQSAETILNAYYQNFTLDKGYSTSINITVQGTNDYGESINTTWDVETYLKHLYEMPTNFSMEALKAQAVAARSYVLAATNNGQNPVCPSQACQEVKTEINDSNWQAAVDQTRGWVMTNSGTPIKAWFSSTHGGYVFTSSDIGWTGTAWTKEARDTSGDVGSFSDLQNNAYDKESPWFYCDWGSRSQYNKTAWLQSGELADIANVLLLAKNDSSTQNHLSQIDKPNPDNTDTWDADRVRQELKNRGITPFNSISSVSVDWDKGVGKTNTVHVNGDGGSQSFNGDDFKNYFNLRAPANIQIVGPLYNVEQK